MKKLTLLLFAIALSSCNDIEKYLDTQTKLSIIQTLDRHKQTAQATIKRTLDNNIQTQPPTVSGQLSISYTDKEIQLKKIRNKLAAQYKSATTQSQKQKIIHQARQAFINANTTLAPYWYGTPWSFHGTSQVPQEGSIACGYFITTLLDDVGLKVQRVKLAQQASEHIIKSLTSEKYIKRFHNASLNKFVTAVERWGAGLYIVGLDFHVGFIWHDGNTVHFIHSTYISPKIAFSEHADSSPVLAASKYRVLGKISDDDQFIKKWLLQQRFITKTK